MEKRRLPQWRCDAILHRSTWASRTPQRLTQGPPHNSVDFVAGQARPCVTYTTEQTRHEQRTPSANPIWQMKLNLGQRSPQCANVTERPHAFEGKRWMGIDTNMMSPPATAFCARKALRSPAQQSRKRGERAFHKRWPLSCVFKDAMCRGKRNQLWQLCEGPPRTCS